MIMHAKDKNNENNTPNDEKLAKNLAKYDKNIKTRKIIASVFFLSVILAFVVSMFYSPQISSMLSRAFSSANAVDLAGKMSVHYVDVGQALGIIVKFDNGQVAVVDTGSASTATDFCNYIKNKIFAHKREYVIDYLILTHSDADHAGGAVKILDNFVVKNIYRPNIYAEFERHSGMVDTSLTWYEVIRAINAECAKGANLFYNASGINIRAGGSVMTFLSPTRDEYTDYNEYSPIIKLRYAGFSHLLTGDATADNEEEVLQTSPISLVSDVLCVAHHGSQTSSTPEFINAVQPKYAVISVGNNSYGHPDESTLGNLYVCGVKPSNLYRTDEDGDVVFVTDSDGTSIYTGGIVVPVRINWNLVAVTVILWCTASGAIVWIRLDKKFNENQKT